MKTFAAALCAVSALAFSAEAASKPEAKPAPKAASKSAGLLKPIHQFIDDFNKGDVKGAEAAHLAAPTIIDEVPPHLWQGDGAFRAWAGDLDKAGKAAGDTDEKVVLGSVIRTQIDGDTGYAVLKATYLYKEKGKAMAEPAQMTFALKKDGGDWKIAGWTWAGTVPHAATAPAAKPAEKAAPAPAAAPPPKK